ncbi:MAG TPA: phosphate ABC transporter permease subunit PstC [Acidimicrobiales bacterium]|nr:phosphate ABC transporter permease subunit PstC [Acidimicrobiales bacterium]
MTTTDPTAMSPSILRRGKVRRGDAVFSFVAQAAGVFVLILIVAIGVFLVGRAVPAFRLAGLHFFTEKTWFPDNAPPVFGIAALAFGTVLSSLCALVLAVPVALGSALFLTELAPPRLGRWTGYMLDLLAAVPSVVYGLWGVYYLVPRLIPVERWLNDTLGFIPLFDSRNGTYGRSLFAASVVLAIMVLPIVAAIAREVFRQVPRADKEAALALGATRWETIRLSVLPYSRSGIVGAIMLGLGRALGETIAVALVLASLFKVDFHILEPGGNTIAANIATKFGEAGVHGREALIASGLVLFAITLVVNVIARGVVYRTGLAAEGKP